MKHITPATETSGDRSFSLALASVLSAFAVVLLHANRCFWIFDGHARYWVTANILESFFYYAVPVFFMITGSTLLQFYDRYGLAVYFKKRFLKTVIPYCFWSLFALLFQIIYLKTIPSDSIDPVFIRNGLLQGKLLSIYWFFPTLFKVYLCVPLFAAVSKEHRKKVFIYLAAGGFLLNTLIPFAIRLSGSKLPHPYSISVVSKYLIFLPIGYLLQEYETKRKTRILIWIAAAAGLFLQIFGTWSFSLSAGAIDDTFKDYTNVPSVAWASGVFLAIKYAGPLLQKNRYISRIVCFLSGYTFSLYLLHWYVLRIMEKEFPINIFSIWYRIGAPFFVMAAVIPFTFLLRKVPLLRRVLP